VEGENDLHFSPTRFKALRERAGLSREQLAIALGRSYVAVSYYERGLHNPPLDVLARAAEVLDCAVDEFFARDVA
jgi:transcriptional regulator with XRE-family HTH domain